jgi:hypothetical protein
MVVCTPIIHLEDAAIVPEKVAGARAGKGILHIRTDVHPHRAVIQVFKFSLQAKINEYLPTIGRVRDFCRGQRMTGLPTIYCDYFKVAR